MGAEWFFIMILGGLLVVFWISQRKFKDKVYCIIHTQHGARREMWLPMWQRHVKYGDRRKGDVGIYFINPAYFTNTHWDKGVNMFFPVQVKTIEFMWYCPFPINFMASSVHDFIKGHLVPAVSWHTPEVRNAAWTERGQRAFAEASAAVGAGTVGGKGLTGFQKVIMLAGFGLGLLAVLLYLSDKGIIPSFGM